MSVVILMCLPFHGRHIKHPEIEDQRFYGFKQLALANNLMDASYLREAIAYDILEAAGLVTPETAFYEVLLDHGTGVASLGVYTMVEVVDDTVVERAFDDADGNIYEADGPAASLAAGTSGQIEASFQKENNKQAADWSDIQKLMAKILRPYLSKAGSIQTFDSAVTELKAFTTQRASTVKAFLVPQN